jgi:predicted Zn-dependent peptidase
MCKEEAALNALLPAVLLRGCVSAPDMRRITLRLDDLYGASVGAQVRRIGDCQTTGFSCNFIEDAYALAGDSVLEPMAAFLGELLLEPVCKRGVFLKEYIESEKRNLILTIEAQLNDKRSYASSQLFRYMAKADSYGIPRLGEKKQVAAITAKSLYAHYQRVLRESPVEIFYVGSKTVCEVARHLRPLFEKIPRKPQPMPRQTPFRDGGKETITEKLEVNQGKLCMGFVTPVTIGDPRYGAMQVLNMIFGGGMTAKLFMQIREKLSLCYDISSGFYGRKGILTVSAGIDFDKKDQVQEKVLQLLADCVKENITRDELVSAQNALLSSLRGTHDSPGAIENFYATAAISGLGMTPEEYMDCISQVTVHQVAEVAGTLELHSVYFLER